ncbi:NACHT domain-containing protein [Streptomyces zhaozhouensis]|uniref:NACHT domain-containing protein n=1 Tax=Streptomyces zhaozhouensis TaxID=1300267 RepID=A0A286DV42_9ACTN|nr:NACHT domain-containing protein [Streptomyces zhaozhouensis]SOD62537.1 NACHT domain-containing protein [Streptomyces zhaozhouensis]
MELASASARVAAGVVGPLVRKLFVRDGVGAGVVDRPVRIASLVSFRGERRELSEKELRKLAGALVRRFLEAGGPHEAPDGEGRRELVEALVRCLHSLGDLDMDDVQAVALGHRELARRLRRPVDVSAEVEARLDALLEICCLHVLNFFSQRSTFVSRTLIEQTRRIDGLVAAVDLLAARVPRRAAEDVRFETRYADHVVRAHGRLSIPAADVSTGFRVPLDSAYVSLEATVLPDGPTAAERVLAGDGRVLLRGAAGAGKSTLAQWVAVATARQSLDETPGHLLGRVPFVLPLRRVVREGRFPLPEDFLRRVGSAVAGGQPDGWVDRVLGAGRGVLLVDGVDELGEDERAEARRWVDDLVGEFPGNLWLVTARPSAVPEGWLAEQGFAEASLSPMGRGEVARFVRRWHGAVDAGRAGGHEERAESLVTAVGANGGLARLATNPLLCGLLCAWHREGSGALLPSGRGELFEAALHTLWKRREGGPGGTGETSMRLLERLAYWMIRNGVAEVGRPDALRQVERALLALPGRASVAAEEAWDALVERSGVLRASAGGSVEFTHGTFRDFLGAKALVEEGDFPLLLSIAREVRGEDVVRMAVARGRPEEAARILDGLVAGGTVRGALLAAACLDHAGRVDPGVRARVVARVSELVPPRDWAAARQLADGGGGVVLELLPGPESCGEREAPFVVAAAGRTGDDAALPLLARYRTHPSLEVRRQLVWCWHRFDTERYAEEVLRHVDERGVYFTVHRPEHLRALRALGGRSRVHVAFDCDPGELVELVDGERLTHLWLREGLRARSGAGGAGGAGGAAWLAALPALRVLVLPEGAEGSVPSLPPGVDVRFARRGEVVF